VPGRIERLDKGLVSAVARIPLHFGHLGEHLPTQPAELNLRKGGRLQHISHDLDQHAQIITQTAPGDAELVAPGPEREGGAHAIQGGIDLLKAAGQCSAPQHRRDQVSDTQGALLIEECPKGQSALDGDGGTRLARLQQHSDAIVERVPRDGGWHGR